MKNMLYKAKGALALTLAVSICGAQCVPVFAAEALSAAQQGVQVTPVKDLTEEEKAALQLPKLTAEEAKSFDFGVTLTSNGNSDIDQSNVHYLYTGFTSKWKLYSSTTTAPTEPGRYVVTVVTLGGDYLAAPITRSFQITK